MGRIHKWLGLTVGLVRARASTTRTLKRAPTTRDVTYGTNTEFGFDYLRDNMAHVARRRWCSGATSYAIVDEVDSILIDEARTPLIISGPVGRVGAALLPVRRHRPRPRAATTTTRSTRRSARSPPPRRASRRSSGRSASTTSTTSCRPTTCTSSRPGAAGQGAVQARQGLHRPGRRGEDRRRVHRPHPRGPALVATACTRRSRPRSGCGSRRRTRPGPRSPSRTTSASTTSSPA